MALKICTGHDTHIEGYGSLPGSSGCSKQLHPPRQPTIDKMIVKFPHLAQEIFKELDYKSIANCQKVSKIWFGLAVLALDSEIQ